MIKALIRFFISNFRDFISGLIMILFDNEEILGTAYSTEKIVNKNIRLKAIEQKALKRYLEKCKKQNLG